MRQEHVLTILYDLTLTIGGEVRLDSLLARVLQRLLFHTAFPAGVVLLATPRPDEVLVAKVVGDHVLNRAAGQTRVMPAGWPPAEAALVESAGAPAWLLGGSRAYSHVLRLPFAPEGEILLLTPRLPESELPLTEVFRPVLSNLAKAMRLCRDSAERTRSLTLDRDRARSDLAAALERAETERTFLRLLINTIPDPVWLKDPDGVYLACNPPFERLYGAAESRIVGRRDADFVPPEVAAAFRANDLAALASPTPHVNEEWLTFRADGYRGLFETMKVAMRDAQQRTSGVLGIARDVTQRRRDAAQLHLAASVFTHAREGIVITDARGLIVQVNDAFVTITGHRREDVIGRSARLLAPGRSDAAQWTRMNSTLRDQHFWDGELAILHRDGHPIPLLLTVSVVEDASAGTRHHVALFSDISRIKEHEQQLRQIAHYDALTHLPNRVLFADRLQQALVQSQRRQTLVAVAMLDLDGFKDINDRYGHDLGDRLLAEVAERLKVHLREGDTLARLGGDEFAATLLDLTSAADGAAVAARLSAALAQPIQLDGHAIRCAASIGLTFYPQAEPVNADQLLRQADQAMYQAKLSGKNRHLIFDPEQDRQVRGQNHLIERLRQALRDDELRLYYQPKVNMRTGRVIGAEALLRWQHPDQGLLAPGAFLPATENHPISLALGDWVLEAALLQMEAWQREGLDISVSVNISPMQLHDRQFVERLGWLLARHPSVPPSRLELEILETSALRDPRQVDEVLRACCRMGLTCALDDFGTGYSTLSYLKQLPAQVLKIDQSFVRDMLDDPDDLAILEAVLGLARAFHREVVAEGVETVAHGSALLQLGCELAQGYGIARPMPPDRLHDWVDQWRPDPCWSGATPARPADLPRLYVQAAVRGRVAHLIDVLEGRSNGPAQPAADAEPPSGAATLTELVRACSLPEPVGQAMERMAQDLQTLCNQVIDLQQCGQGTEAVRALPTLLEQRDRLLRLLETT